VSFFGCLLRWISPLLEPTWRPKNLQNSSFFQTQLLNSKCLKIGTPPTREPHFCLLRSCTKCIFWSSNFGVFWDLLLGPHFWRLFISIYWFWHFFGGPEFWIFASKNAFGGKSLQRTAQEPPKSFQRASQGPPGRLFGRLLGGSWAALAPKIIFKKQKIAGPELPQGQRRVVKSRRPQSVIPLQPLPLSKLLHPQKQHYHQCQVQAPPQRGFTPFFTSPGWTELQIRLIAFFGGSLIFTFGFQKQ